MNKKIKNIQFVLENCECIEVPAEAFDVFRIENFYTQKLIEYDKNDDEQLGEIHTITKFRCIIKQNENIKNTFTWQGNKTKPIDRLKQNNDICAIYINLEDNSEEHYEVKWWGESPNYSLGQHTYFDEFDRLHIKIAKPPKKKLKEVNNA